ncbi:glycosyltransferase family 2 protein [Pedobacter sp. MR22-3]|uniref:glycosyltransferase family 2 protein n=1 Tax=Pedobacter sp. MR22-3 TaxID=2994552 RepID=UPI002247FAE8|nr:glycosyltransferase family 2 protein [Pedobacter sp. MR22-3]MCX2583709.1 glycosyltransferase family 2 protein [Pedobacter sp. MR22-3]
MEPLVSIIVPCHNSAKFITATLNSVIAQNYTSWELIIIDDKSSDDTCTIVEKFANQHNNIQLIRLPENKGVSHARNLGMAKAGGKYIAFLDSDDIWLENKLGRQVAYMEKEMLSLTFCAYNRINEDGDIISGVIPAPFSVSYTQLLSHNVIIFSTSMMLKSTIGDLQFSKAGHEDWIFFLQLLKKCKLGYGINEPLALYRIRKHSQSSNKMKAIVKTWKIFRESEKLGLVKSVYHFINYAVLTVLKRLR